MCSEDAVNRSALSGYKIRNASTKLYWLSPNSKTGFQIIVLVPKGGEK